MFCLFLRQLESSFYLSLYFEYRFHTLCTIDRRIPWNESSMEDMDLSPSRMFVINFSFSYYLFNAFFFTAFYNSLQFY